MKQQLLRTVTIALVSLGLQLSTPKVEGESLNSETCVVAGQNLEKQGDFDRAIDSYRQCLSLYSGDGKASRLLASLLADRAKFDEAEAILRRAIEQNPQEFEFYDKLGEILLHQKKVPEFIALYHQARSRKPDEPWMYETLVSLASQYPDRSPEILSLLREYLAINPDKLAAYLYLGKVLELNGQLEEAIAIYRKSIDRLPQEAFHYYPLGELLQKVGKIDEAIEVYRQAILKEPENIYLNYGLAETLTRQGKFDRALTVYRQAIDKLPQEFESYRQLANALWEQKKFDEVLATYQLFVSRSPKNPRGYHALAFAFYRLERCDEALAAFEKLTQLDPNEKVSYDEMTGLISYYETIGDILQKQGKLKAALVAYQKALQYYPQRDRVREEIVKIEKLLNK